MNDELAKLKLARDACLSNAHALWQTAERELDKGIDHICFHLALLALEEIGKAVLLPIRHTVALSAPEYPTGPVALDDHTKKIFWALWGGIMRGDPITGEQIKQYQGLASGLHERRLQSLYTDPTNPLTPESRLDTGEARRLIDLVKARYEIEMAAEVIDSVPDEALGDFKWFFQAIEDPEKRPEIFGSKSLQKLADVRNGYEWVKWLHGIYESQAKDMRELAEKEVKRQKPQEGEAFKPKFKMRVRIQSLSHAVRNDKAFLAWNAAIENLKIHKSERKDKEHLAKAELVLELIIPKTISIQGVYDYGFFSAKTFVISLNIATHGLFWWHVLKDIDKYYEDIIDLEADPKEKVKVTVVRGKRLSIDWDKAGMVLDENELNLVNTVYLFLLREHKKLEKFLTSYAFAMSLFSKIDIHLRLDANAFEEFFNAFKQALIIMGDWDETTDLIDTAKKKLSILGKFDELEATLRLGLQFLSHNSPRPSITLTEIASMKLYCDLYIRLKASEYLKSLKSDKE